MHERDDTIGLLFVCMGNICRSPTAEAIFRAKVSANGLDGQVRIDSAGTHAYHVGNPPDPRSQAVAKERGISMHGQQARRVSDDDFHVFDHIVAMDQDNMRNLLALRPDSATAALSLMLSHDPAAERDEVPDPYYGGARGFDQVFDMVDRAAEHLLEKVRVQLASS
ncbi:MAG: low molecular weight protein-tyrosine-phosphatase [Pseudomonadota bacterium]